MPWDVVSCCCLIDIDMCVDLDFVFLLWRLSEWLPHVGFECWFWDWYKWWTTVRMWAIPSHGYSDWRVSKIVPDDFESWQSMETDDRANVTSGVRAPQNEIWSRIETGSASEIVQAESELAKDLIHRFTFGPISNDLRGNFFSLEDAWISTYIKRIRSLKI